MIDFLLQLVPSIAAGVACGLSAWGAMRVELHHMRRDVTRAHKRLDLIGAPNVTLDTE